MLVAILALDEEKAYANCVQDALNTAGFEVVPSGLDIDAYKYGQPGAVNANKIGVALALWTKKSASSSYLKDLSTGFFKQRKLISLELELGATPEDLFTKSMLSLPNPEDGIDRYLIRLVEMAREFDPLQVDQNLGLQLAPGESIRIARRLADLVNRPTTDASGAVKQTPSGRFCRIGSIQIRLDRNEIEQDGKVDNVPNMAMRVLEELITADGRVVSKQHLLDSVWKDRVIEDNGVDKCISQLRAILGDRSKPRKIIQSISKRGYRIAAPINFFTNS